MGYSGDMVELQAMLDGRSPVIPVGPSYTGGRATSR